MVSFLIVGKNLGLYLRFLHSTYSVEYRVEFGGSRSRRIVLAICGQCNPLEYACECATRGGFEADLPADALRAIFSVAASRPTSFFGRHETTQDGVPKVPSQGWLGVWFQGQHWQHIDLRTDIVRRILKDEGFDRGVIDRWLERGWLQPAPSMGKRAKVRLDGALVNVYRFSRAAIDEVVG